MMDLYVRIDKRGMTMHSFINTWGSDRTQWGAYYDNVKERANKCPTPNAFMFRRGRTSTTHIRCKAKKRTHVLFPHQYMVN
jgi:hypothetical protein